MVYGEPTLGKVEIRNSLHWFSVNQGVDQCKVFEGEAFESLEIFEQFVDPKKANASSLLESTPIESNGDSNPK